MKINWIQKLSSRKFWAGVVSFTTAILTAFNASELTSNQVTLIVSGIGALMIYMLAEGKADSTDRSGR